MRRCPFGKTTTASPSWALAERYGPDKLNAGNHVIIHCVSLTHSNGGCRNAVCYCKINSVSLTGQCAVMMPPKPPLRLLFLEVYSRYLSMSKSSFFLFCFVTCQNCLLEWRIGSRLFGSDFTQPFILGRWVWIMRPWGHRLVSKKPQ